MNFVVGEVEDLGGICSVGWEIGKHYFIHIIVKFLSDLTLILSFGMEMALFALENTSVSLFLLLFFFVVILKIIFMF